MTKNALADKLRNPGFADRDTLAEAMEYAMDLLGRNIHTLTALQVVLNTLANKIEALEDQ